MCRDKKIRYLKLASLNKQTVWVGDQKQSIYGFRGTDPALMDACIEHLFQDRSPETLGKSWRSRPPAATYKDIVKIHQTSDIFYVLLSRWEVHICDIITGRPIRQYWADKKTRNWVR